MTLTLDAQPTVPAVDDQQAPARTRVAVQQRQRLFREGISQLLGAEPDLEVVGMVTTDAELVQACREHRPTVAVIEGEVGDWDVPRLVTTLRRTVTGLAVIGLTPWPATASEQARARRAGMRCLLSRDTGIAGILTAVRSPVRTFAGAVSTPTAGTGPGPSSTAAVLTSREVEVLSLVAAGLTSTAVAGCLHISHKTVENHKQRIFAKLEVQNQAHAVSVAMRTGVLRPDRVMELASSE
jgi:DNA-binding NarL/FixJ family response regulator